MKTEYSFNHVYGKIEDVHKHALELGWSALPIDDIMSTFGFVSWNELCLKTKVKPIFGVTLGVTAQIGQKKPAVSNFTFYAINKIRSINDLVGLATGKAGRFPLLEYEETINGEIITIADNKVDLSKVRKHENFYVALNPATPIGLFRSVKHDGFKYIAHVNNSFNYKNDRLTYHTIIRDAETALYPQWILSDEEWRAALPYTVTDEEAQIAIDNRNQMFERCNAQLLKAKVFKPIDNYSLRDIAIQGAKDLNVDLTNPVYAERFERELNLIEEKGYADYFYIVHDLVKFAKKNMIVGPGRGSSAGCLICYLTGITTIDPIPFGLLFERFIDVSRADLPDIDLDFSDEKRHIVFDYLKDKYGQAHVAHLGTVMKFRSKSLMNKSGISLGIPKWLSDAVADTLIERSSADARAQQTFAESFSATELGKKLITEYPEISTVFEAENHASNAGSHAAGVAITNEEIIDFVAIDNRNGTIMADKFDCEKLNILKIDILGLSQLSIFERCLELIGKEPRNGYLENLPLDDKLSFEVLNKRQYSGIFQAMGKSLQILFNMITSDNLGDLVAITSLSRPGPVASGGAVRWCRKRSGTERVTYLHPSLMPFLAETYGEVVYQEQIMCLDGKTMIEQPHGGNRTRFPTIEELYNLCQSYPMLYNNVKYHPSLISLNEELKIGISQRATKIIQSGVKDCYKFIFDDGSYVICTLNHQFIINEEWKCCGDSIIGDKWNTLYKERIQMKRSSGAQTKIIKEAIINFREKMKNKKCEDCDELKNAMHIHHNDFNEGKTNPLDLSWLCAKCHSLRHDRGIGDKLWKKSEKISYIKLLKIEHVGERMTYDIVMPIHHNFKLANGLITHNSICRDIGHMGLNDINKIRKAMSKSLGTVEMNKMGEPFIEGASPLMGEETTKKLWGEIIQFGAWAFNKSHAVSYGIVTYYCCYLKAHYPVEFAAATLDSEYDPLRQLYLLRELAIEGIKYKAIDPDYSTDRWSIKEEDGKKILIGPLTNIKGIGPALVKKIMEARQSGATLTPGLKAKLDSAITKIDSLTPIRDAINKLHPDLKEINIVSIPTNICDLEAGMPGYYTILALVKRIQPRDLNDIQSVAKRGGRKIEGQSWVLRIFVNDDTDEILTQIDTKDYLTAGKAIEEKGGQGDSLYAIRGTIPETFRMLKITNIRYLGKMSDIDKPVIKNDLFGPATPPKPFLIPTMTEIEE